MRAYRLRKVATLAAMLTGVAVSGAVVAQDGVRPPKVELSVGADAELSVEQQLQQADATARKAAQLAARLTRMLDEARRDKDILRANCVNRKLTEVNANSRNVEQRHKALKDAIETHDEARVNHEYTVLSVLGQKLDSLGVEAGQCLGQSVYEPGASQVTTTVPGSAPRIDPSVVPASPPPPAAVTVPPFVEGNTPLSPAS